MKTAILVVQQAPAEFNKNNATARSRVVLQSKWLSDYDDDDDDICNVEEQSPGHFYWPEIDVDLSESIIENPMRYPKQASHNKPKHTDSQ